MKTLFVSVLLLGWSTLSGQTDSDFDVQGVLKLIDRPPDGTPVEALRFSIHPLGGGFDIETQPDRNGSFTLNKVRPGRYSLTFPMPGRIESFTRGSEELPPEGFELRSGGTSPVVLVITMKASDVIIKARAFPSGRDVVALLAPADAHLTLRLSCYANQLIGPETTFGFVPPGKYRVFIVDAELQQDVAAYAPRFPGFLKNEATPVDVPAEGRIEATATYLDGANVREAIREAGPLFPLSPAR